MVSAKHRREYDLFGPWILEVEGADDVPDAFLSYYPSNQIVDLAFKVPHQIERRNARPGDDLYDYFVLLTADRIDIYKRIGGGIENTGAVYDQIVGVKVLSDLLYGELTLFLEDEAVSLPFNTISEDVIQRVVSLIRERCATGPPTPLPAATTNRDALTQLYRVLLTKERKVATVALVAFQDELPIMKREKTLWDRGIDLIRRPKLRPAMFLVSERELIIYHGDPQIVRFRKGNYGYARTVIPFRAIHTISAASDPVYDRCATLTISVPTHEFVIHTEDTFREEAVVAAIPAVKER